MTESETKRVLIWGKTYPELSSHHTETVCTGGVLEDGRPIRLYPVPLRYLEQGKNYSLYSIIEVRAHRTSRDNRPESHKIDPGTLRVVGHIATDTQEWAERRRWLWRDTSWHFDSVDQLEAARQATDASIGLIQPGQIDRVYLKRKPDKARREHAEKWEAVTSQVDMFLPEYKALEFLPYEIRLQWRCAVRCSQCSSSAHDYMVLDWGLLELARRDGDWEAARLKLETISNLAVYDFRIFVGNFFLHQQTFGAIGLWYPKRRDQFGLL
ncbi:MAG: hypothetical protein ACYC0B_02180 [Gemmatimonadaceae bacterium]